MNTLHVLTFTGLGVIKCIGFELKAQGSETPQFLRTELQ